MNPRPTIDAMRTAAQTAQDALDATKAVLLAQLEASKDYELDGASTLNTWVRNQLRMNAGQATTLVKNVAALRDLPRLAEAALTGQVSAAHVRVFVYGLAHVGLEPDAPSAAGDEPATAKPPDPTSGGPPACPHADQCHTGGLYNMARMTPVARARWPVIGRFYR